MSCCDMPDSIDGLPSALPPQASSVSIELKNAQPSESFLPASARSCT